MGADQQERGLQSPFLPPGYECIEWRNTQRVAIPGRAITMRVSPACFDGMFHHACRVTCSAELPPAYLVHAQPAGRACAIGRIYTYMYVGLGIPFCGFGYIELCTYIHVNKYVRVKAITASGIDIAIRQQLLVHRHDSVRHLGISGLIN